MRLGYCFYGFRWWRVPCRLMEQWVLIWHVGMLRLPTWKIIRDLQSKEHEHGLAQKRWNRTINNSVTTCNVFSQSVVKSLLHFLKASQCKKKLVTLFFCLNEMVNCCPRTISFSLFTKFHFLHVLRFEMYICALKCVYFLVNICVSNNYISVEVWNRIFL